MPCPPSWEELLDLRLSRSAEELRADLERDWPALLPTVELVKATSRRSPDFAQDLDVTRALLEATRLAGTRPQVHYPGRWAENFPSAAELTRDEAELDQVGQQVALAELALCVLRTWLACWWYAHGKPDDDPALTAALDAHRRHRTEDRDAALRQLEAQVNSATLQQNAALVATLEERRARLRGLDERTLLCDRGSTC